MTTLKKSVLEKYLSPYFFETGTADGSAVQMALELNFEKIFSIEIDERLYNENLKKFEYEIKTGRVNLFLGDTIEVMSSILEKHIGKKTTFWLDAHVDSGPMGIKKCPIYEEIDFIKKTNIFEHSILIDDIRCFDGGCWGEVISLDILESKIKGLNPNYTFGREDGHVEKDILVAYL